MLGKVTYKTDTYAFGIVILEIITGLPAARPEGSWSSSRILPATSTRNLPALWRGLLFEFHERLTPWIDAPWHDLPRPALLNECMNKLHWVVSKCLELNSQRRSTVAELITDLHQIDGQFLFQVKGEEATRGEGRYVFLVCHRVVLRLVVVNAVAR